MNAKQIVLEKKIEELTKWLNIKKRELPVKEWLNENYSDTIDFNTWLISIKINRAHLELIFKNDFIIGNGQILKMLLSLENGKTNIPIKSFDQKENILYVFTNDSWDIMSQESFKTMMNSIDNKIREEFLKWQTENKDKMYKDDFSNIYTSNVKKLLGGSQTTDQLYNKIKKDLYNYLKINLKDMMQQYMIV